MNATLWFAVVLALMASVAMLSVFRQRPKATIASIPDTFSENAIETVLTRPHRLERPHGGLARLIETELALPAEAIALSIPALTRRLARRGIRVRARSVGVALKLLRENHHSVVAVRGSGRYPLYRRS